MGDAHGAQLAHQQPETLFSQFRVATANKVEVAVQGAVTDRAICVQAGMPLVGRAKQFQRRIGGHYLHDRAGIEGHIRIQEAGVPGAVQGDGGDCQMLVCQFQVSGGLQYRCQQGRRGTGMDRCGGHGAKQYEA